MSLTAATIVLPLAYLTTQFYVESSDKLKTSKLEIGGIAYVTPLQQTIYHLQRRRGAVALYNAGSQDTANFFKAETENTRNAFAALTEVHAKQESLFNLESAWADLKPKIELALTSELSLNKQKHIALHNAAVEQLLAFQAVISEKSMLDLNHYPESYYLLELTQKLAAPLGETMGQLRAVGTAYLTSGIRDARALGQVNGLYGTVLYRLQAIRQIRARVLNYNDTKKEEIDKVYSNQENIADSFQALYEKLITSGAGTARNAQEYFNASSAYVDALYKMSQVANEIVVENLKERHRSLLVRQWTVLTLTTLGVLLSFLLGVYMLRHIMRSLDSALKLANGLSQGDLEQEIHIQGTDEIAVFMRSLKTTVAKLREVLQSVHQSASEISLASQQVASTAEMLNNGAMDQAAHVEETGAALGEMVNLIGSNANNAIETDKTANVAMDNTKKGADNVLKAVESMRVISERIQIVQEIASQTNLLALNATIEAARAGEHGRGFAVVATEVGKLADTSGQAAKQIQELLHESSRISETAASSLSLITDSMQDTAHKVVAIRKASEEQDMAAKQINESMGRLNQTTEQTASAAEELAATAEEMSSQTSLLMENLKFFTFKREEAENPVLAALKQAKKGKEQPAKAATPSPAAPSSKSLVSPHKQQSTEEFIVSTGEYEKF